MAQFISPEFRKNNVEEALDDLTEARRKSAELREKQRDLNAKALRIRDAGTWSDVGVAHQSHPGRIGYSEVKMTLKGTRFVYVEGTFYSVALQDRIGNANSLQNYPHLLVGVPKNEASSSVDEDDVQTFAVFRGEGKIEIEGIPEVTTEALQSVEVILDFLEVSTEK